MFSPEETFDLLNIDAWRDGEGGWSWNDARRIRSGVSLADIAETRGDGGPPDAPTRLMRTRRILRWMRDEGMLSARSAGKVTIDWDGFNAGDGCPLEVQHKNTREPLFAFQAERI